MTFYNCWPSVGNSVRLLCRSLKVMPGRNCAFFGCSTSQKHQISLFRIPVVSAHEVTNVVNKKGSS